MSSAPSPSSEQVHINVPNENYVRIVREPLRASRSAARSAWCSTTFDQRELVARSRAGVRPAHPSRRAPQTAIVDWGFNAWGGKYPPYDDDDAVPTRSGG